MTCDVWSTCPLLRARSGRRRVKAAVWTTPTGALWRGECRVIYTLGPWALAPCLVRCIIYTRGISHMYSVVKCVCFRNKKLFQLSTHTFRKLSCAPGPALCGGRRPAAPARARGLRPCVPLRGAPAPPSATVTRHGRAPPCRVSHLSLTHCSVSLYNSRTYLSSLS